jgi:hypothetical protein
MRRLSLSRERRFFLVLFFSNPACHVKVSTWRWGGPGVRLIFRYSRASRISHVGSLADSLCKVEAPVTNKIIREFALFRRSNTRELFLLWRETYYEADAITLGKRKSWIWNRYKFWSINLRVTHSGFIGQPITAHRNAMTISKTLMRVTNHKPPPHKL